MRRLACLSWLAVVVAGCTSPEYGNGHLQCAPSSRACPSGFYCAADNHCWLDGSGPSGSDLGVPSTSDLAGAVLDLLGGAGGDLAITPSKCPNVNALICESFEGPLLNWGQTGRNGSPGRDTTRAYRGTTSLRAHIGGGPAMSNPSATINSMMGLPIAAGRLFARVWAYFPSGLPGQFNQFLNFTDAGSTGVSLASDTGNLTLDDSAGSAYTRSTTAIPLDRWTCIQFEMVQGSPNGPLKVSIDGQQLNDLSSLVATTPTAVSVILGLDFYNNSAPLPTYDAWFDELIVDNKATTCDE